jgi:hypothetical protein
MKKWKKFVLVNIGGLTGIVLSLFIVPGNTPVPLWAICAGGVLILMNYFFVFRRMKSENQHKRELGAARWIIILGFMVLLLDLIWTFYSRHH